MTNDKTFILVDDDPINNMLCKLSIKNAVPEAEVVTFTVPEKGLEYVQQEYQVRRNEHAILFLDLNMPTLTGWEFMEQFENCSETVKSQITVYILSSSVDERDIARANQDNLIRGFISKPIDADRVLAVLSAEESEK